jgi:hypothetical protein
MKKAGLTEEQYKDPEVVAEYFTNLWNNSAKGRTSAIAICLSEDGLYHGHMVCYGNTTTLSNVAKVLFGSHVEPVKGSKEQLAEYIKKEGKYQEKGENILYSKNLECIKKSQGERKDLQDDYAIIDDMLNNGAKPKDIFNISIRFRKYENMIRNANMDRLLKITPLEKDMYNEYHFGKSGTGKSHVFIELCKKYSPDDVYKFSDYANSGSSGGGLDFYADNPTPILFLDEFKGNMDYGTFLVMLDKYSRDQFHCRFRNVYQLWTSVYVASIYSPDEVYDLMVKDTRKNVDSFQQLIRRFNKIVYHYINKKGKYRTYELPANQYVSKSAMIKEAMEFEELFEKELDMKEEVLKAEENKDATDNIPTEEKKDAVDDIMTEVLGEPASIIKYK